MDANCQLCEPAPHPNCESYSEVEISDPATGESGYVTVCMEHLKTIESAIS